MSAQIHPNGFRISDRPVAASFAHPYSFQPLPDYSLRDDACISSSMSMGGVEGAWVRYWDEASTVAMLEFQVEEPVQTTHAAPAKEKKEKRKAKGAQYLSSVHSTHHSYSHQVTSMTSRSRHLPFPYPTSQLHSASRVHLARRLVSQLHLHLDQ